MTPKYPLSTSCTPEQSSRLTETLKITFRPFNIPYYILSLPYLLDILYLDSKNVSLKFPIFPNYCQFVGLKLKEIDNVHGQGCWKSSKNPFCLELCQDWYLTIISNEMCREPYQQLPLFYGVMELSQIYGTVFQTFILPIKTEHHKSSSKHHLKDIFKILTHLRIWDITFFKVFSTAFKQIGKSLPFSPTKW